MDYRYLSSIFRYPFTGVTIGYCPSCGLTARVWGGVATESPLPDSERLLVAVDTNAGGCQAVLLEPGAASEFAARVSDALLISEWLRQRQSAELEEELRRLQTK
jgi:hypothetical protein